MTSLVWMLLMAAMLQPALRTDGVRVAAVGDIACEAGRETTANRCRSAEVADRIDAEGVAWVLVLGDLQYPDGTLRGFREGFGRTWAGLLPRLLPVPGNHEYRTPNAAGYRDFLSEPLTRLTGAPTGRTWYALTVGDWRVLALDSNCEAVGGCGEGSPQHAWLRRELEAGEWLCTLAFWHHPSSSSGAHGPNPAVAPLWELLAQHDAEAVLSGHDHHYERFAPLDASAEPDPEGVRQFVVGVGGASFHPVLRTRPGREALEQGDFGALILDLAPGSYAWRFVNVEGEVLDQGADLCR